MNKFGISGHRPPRLGLNYTEKDEKKLITFFKGFFSIYLSHTKDEVELNCGMAQGADICAAYAFLELGLGFHAYLPFRGMESKWPTETQRKWNKLLDKALSVCYVCEDGYDSWKFIKRDKAMVDNSSKVFFLLDNKPEKSGTRHTWNYAIEQEVEVMNLWKLWEDFLIG